MNYRGQNLLLKFIDMESDSYDAVFNAVQKYTVNNKKHIFRKESLQNGYINSEYTELDFKFADKITISENTVNFDLIVEGTFATQVKTKYDYEDDSDTAWFRLNCQMVVTDHLYNFKVINTNEYSRVNYAKDSKSATQDLVPIIERKDFDREAEAFLNKYCPEALQSPMPVPIYEIAKNKMGLEVVLDKMLTSEHAIFGQVCFLDGVIKTYDELSKHYIDTAVKRGTIFIDPQTYYYRNLGCVNNTIAHEAFHWERHRIFATIKSLTLKKDIIVHRCPISQSRLSKDLDSSPEAWLEWQANNIAPKILMPKITADKKLRELITKYDYLPDDNRLDELKLIIDELAEFFHLSKQAAKIRVIELGCEEATLVYNYDSDTSFLSNNISNIDAFSELMNNLEFQTLFNQKSNLFRFVENCFVINSPDYIHHGKNGLELTDYARENIEKCTLQFKHNLELIVKTNRKNGVLYRDGVDIKDVGKFVSTQQNEQVINEALIAAEKFKKDFDLTKNLSGTTAECIAKVMKSKK